MKWTDIEIKINTEDNPKGKVVLVGMLSDGPAGIPFSLKDGIDPKKTLGDNTLTTSYEYLIETGVLNENIMFYRLNGSPSELFFKINDLNAVEFRSVGMSQKDNNFSLTVSKDGITIMELEEFDLNEEEKNTIVKTKRTYLFNDFAYIGELVAMVNQDASFGLINVIAKESINTLSRDVFNREGIYPFMQTGDSEEALTTRNMNAGVSYEEDYWPLFYDLILGEEFDGSFNTFLYNLPVEVMYFPDIPIEKAYNVSKIAAMLANEKTKQQKIMCIALFNASSVPNVKKLKNDEYMISDTTYFDSEKNEILLFEPYKNQIDYVDNLINLYPEAEKEEDDFLYLQVTVGEDSLFQENKKRPASDYYLSNYLQLPFYESLTNKELVLFKEIRSNLSKSLIATLSSKGYICSIPSIRKNFVFTKAKSMQKESQSLLTQFKSNRIVSYINYDLENLMERYIGNEKNALETAKVLKEIQDYMDFFIEANILSEHHIEFKEDELNINNIILLITLKLYGEVESVRTTLSIKEEEWEVDPWSIIM